MISYARQVSPFVERAERAYRLWLGRSSEVPRTEVLANAASVQRWEFASWVEALSQIAPPPEAAKLHGQMLAGLRDGARASQLLSSGYRSTTYFAVCDGQALLVRALDCLRPVGEQIAQWSALPIPAAPARRRPAARAEARRAS